MGNQVLKNRENAEQETVGKCSSDRGKSNVIDLWIYQMEKEIQETIREITDASGQPRSDSEGVKNRIIPNKYINLYKNDSLLRF